MLKLKKFSNKLNKDALKKSHKKKKTKMIKIKRKKLVYNKKSKFIAKKYFDRHHKVINSPYQNTLLSQAQQLELSCKHDNSISTKNSSKIRKLLNDSRGISKYMINYDLNEFAESPSTSILNTTKYFFDNTFDNVQLDLQFDHLENQIMQLPSIDYSMELFNDKQLIEYTFNDDDLTIVKSNCSSGYLSDF